MPNVFFAHVKIQQFVSILFHFWGSCVFDRKTAVEAWKESEHEGNPPVRRKGGTMASHQSAGRCAPFAADGGISGDFEKHKKKGTVAQPFLSCFAHRSSVRDNDGDLGKPSISIWKFLFFLGLPSQLAVQPDPFR